MRAQHDGGAGMTSMTCARCGRGRQVRFGPAGLADWPMHCGEPMEIGHRPPSGERFGGLLVAVVVLVAVALGGLVPVTVWPYIAFAAVAAFVTACITVPRRR